MAHGLREEIDNRNADDDEHDADAARPIHLLAPKEHADEHRQHDANTRPERVRRAKRNGFQAEGKQVEGKSVSDHHDQAGDEFRKPLRKFEGGGCGHFAEDGEEEDQCGFHGCILFIGFGDCT